MGKKCGCKRKSSSKKRRVKKGKKRVQRGSGWFRSLLKGGRKLAKGGLKRGRKLAKGAYKRYGKKVLNDVTLDLANKINGGNQPIDDMALD